MSPTLVSVGRSRCLPLFRSLGAMRFHLAVGPFLIAGGWEKQGYSRLGPRAVHVCVSVALWDYLL